MTKKIKNKDLKMDLRVKHEDDRVEQSGRSMVEMLGTLAIIGVLSVGGIAGYTYSMNKYYANELLAGASARAVIVASQLASGRESSLSEFDKMETAGGEFDNKNIAKFSDGFGIKVSKVKKSVCENLIKDTEGTDIGIETEAGGEVTCGDENTFFITFDSLGVSGGSSGETNTPCANNTEKCSSGTYYVCEDGKWVSQSLPSEKVCNGDTLEPTDSCSSYYLLCLNGTTYFCAYPSNTWEVLEDQTGYGSDRCALGTCEEGQETCIDDVYYYCCGVTWIGEEGCCTGGAVADGKCENGTYYSCCGGEWTEEGDNVGCCLGNGSNVADIGTQRCLEMSGMYIQQTCVSSPYGREWLGNAGPDCCDDNGNLVTCTCDNWVYADMHPDECS